jgi:hypothetical protein
MIRPLEMIANSPVHQCVCIKKKKIHKSMMLLYQWCRNYIVDAEYYTQSMHYGIYYSIRLLVRIIQIECNCTKSTSNST